MANGAFKFKDNSGNVVSFISGSGSNISFSGGTLDLSGMTGLTLGNLTLSGTTQNALSASHAASYLLTSSFNTYSGTTDTVIGTLQTSTGSLNSFTSSATTRLNSIEGVSGSYATTGSNLFKGNQTISGSIIPAVDNAYDLGSSTHQFRDLYLSSASLYIDGTKVLGSTAQELQITTDTGQSFKILEAGSDNITLQSTDGNIELKSSGGGDVIMDPTTGVIALKGTTTVYAGNKILSSDGNAIQFGNSVTVTGSIIVTGYIETQELRTTYISSSILYRSGSTKFGDELSDTHSFTGSLLVSGTISVPGSNLVSGSSQVLNGSGVFSGSAQLPSGIVSSSAQTIANLPSGTVSGSAQTIANLPSGTVSGSSQILNGTGFVKTSGASITYDNSTYLTTESDTLSSVTARGASTSTALSLGQVSTSTRLSVGASDQTYASIFVGGDITTGVNQYAIIADPQLSGTSNSYALFANARIKANTAVTNTFGVYIPSAEKLTGASIVNNYALYIANQTAGSTTNYSIYSSGGRNYFGDKVSIGSNTFFTVAQFLVNGGLSAGSSAIAQFNGFIRMKDQLIIHNDANTGLESYLQCTAANEITTLNLKTTNLYASGNLVTIGNWTTATTLQFHSANNSIGRINFYDANDTEGVYIKNTGVQHGGDLRFGARWDDDEDKVYFNLRQSSAGAAYDARFGLNVDPTETFHISSHGTTASAPSLGWPVYNAELDTNARRFRFETKGNGGVSTAGQGGTVAIILGQYYDSRVLITAEGNGSSSPGDQGQGRGKDLMLKAGTADNGVGFKGGRLYLNGGMGYASTYNANVGTIFMQSLSGGGVVNIGTTTGEVRTLNVTNSIGVRTNLTGTEQEIFNVGNTGSGVNDGYMRLLDSGTVKVLIAANNGRGGDTFFNGGGNFAINTDTASYKLHVNGTAYATGAAGALSDIRHKKNIVPTLKGLTELLNLNPVEFEWNEDKVADSGMLGTHLGFIAQEIKDILPNTVLTQPNSENTLGLKYNEFIPLLVKSIQEQQQIISDLKDRITILETN